MFSKVRDLMKTFLTQTTFIELLSCVFSHVPGRNFEEFPTHMTFKSFLSSVDPIVVSKVRTLKKATSTETTFVWFLSSVNHLVLSESKAITKDFSTQSTLT